MCALSPRTGALLGALRDVDGSAVTALAVLSGGRVAVGTEAGAVVLADVQRVRLVWSMWGLVL